MIREIRIYMFTLLIHLATEILPNDAKKTWEWISEMPIE